MGGWEACSLTHTQGSMPEAQHPQAFVAFEDSEDFRCVCGGGVVGCVGGLCVVHSSPFVFFQLQICAGEVICLSLTGYQAEAEPEESASSLRFSG